MIESKPYGNAYTEDRFAKPTFDEDIDLVKEIMDMKISLLNQLDVVYSKISFAIMVMGVVQIVTTIITAVVIVYAASIN